MDDRAPSEAAIGALLSLAGLHVPAGDVAPLAEALRHQLALLESLERALPEGPEPALVFDPRWNG